MLQSAILAKGAVTGKRISTHSWHPFIAAISIGTRPFCQEGYQGDILQIKTAELREKQSMHSCYIMSIFFF
jgi:hypothetical protein